jgi:DNA replication protein DnaC
VASGDLQQQWDLLAPGLQHAHTNETAAGFRQSLQHAHINPEAHGQNPEYDLALDLGLAHLNTTSNNPLRYNMSDENYFNLMQSLSKQQLEFLNEIINHLKTSTQPIYRFLSGGAGTGKSYVLKALRETIER